MPWVNSHMTSPMQRSPGSGATSSRSFHSAGESGCLQDLGAQTFGVKNPRKAAREQEAAALGQVQPEAELWGLCRTAAWAQQGWQQMELLSPSQDSPACKPCTLQPHRVGLFWFEVGFFCLFFWGFFNARGKK